MPQGLPRKIRIAFIMQVVLASVAILVGAYLISAVLITHITHPSLRACTAMAAYVLRHRAIWAPVLPTRSVD